MTVEYFVPDERKADGAYATATERGRHVSPPERIPAMEEGLAVALEDIVAAGEGDRFGV